MEKKIRLYGQDVTVSCDEKCHKAWGLNSRPKVVLSETDALDIAWLSDDELDAAPVDPGTYEGGEGKPVKKSEMLNKWCVRECERSLIDEGQGSEPCVMDWSKRIYNKLHLHPEAQ